MLGVAFISIIICGLIGIAIARYKGVSQALGFILGFFIGPFGLVIIALLSPSLRRIGKSARFAGIREATDDTYRLWLTNKYDIERNGTLDRYTASGRSFTSLEEAFLFANSLEDHNEESHDRNTLIVKRIAIALVCLGGAITLIIGGKHAFLVFQHHSALQSADDLIAAKRFQLDHILKSAGLSLHPAALMVSRDFSDRSTDELLSGDFIEANVQSPIAQFLDPCSVDIETTPITDPAGKAVWFNTKTTSASIMAFYRQASLQAGYRESHAFDEEHQTRIAFERGKQTLFISSHDDDMGNNSTVICILNRAVMNSAAERLQKFRRIEADGQAAYKRSQQELKRILGMK